MTNINIADDALILLKEFADDRRVTLIEALRMAIATQSYIHERLKSGGTILVLEADKTINEVLFR